MPPKSLASRMRSRGLCILTSATARSSIPSIRTRSTRRLRRRKSARPGWRQRAATNGDAARLSACRAIAAQSARLTSRQLICIYAEAAGSRLILTAATAVILSTHTACGRITALCRLAAPVATIEQRIKRQRGRQSEELALHETRTTGAINPHGLALPESATDAPAISLRMAD